MLKQREVQTTTATCTTFWGIVWLFTRERRKMATNINATERNTLPVLYNITSCTVISRQHQHYILYTVTWQSYDRRKSKQPLKIWNTKPYYLWYEQLPKLGRGLECILLVRSFQYSKTNSVSHPITAKDVCNQNCPQHWITFHFAEFIVDPGANFVSRNSDW